MEIVLSNYPQDGIRDRVRRLSHCPDTLDVREIEQSGCPLPRLLQIQCPQFEQPFRHLTRVPSRDLLPRVEGRNPHQKLENEGGRNYFQR